MPVPGVRLKNLTIWVRRAKRIGSGDMMETVLIADDEKNIREGIKYIIDWEALGFTVCGEAANGEEALKQIYEL